MSPATPLDPYAAPRTVADSPHPSRHTRWGVVSLVAGVGNLVALAGFVAFVLAVVLAQDGQRPRSGWTQAVGIVWMLLLFLGAAVAAFAGLVGCLRFRRRRWTAVIGVALGMAELFALFAAALAA